MLLFFCLLLTVFYIVGLLVFLTDHEPGNNCEMTYMFEYPQYVRISQEIDEQYVKYGLYAYGEGRTTKKARNMYFDGIPVLFVPGNAGSYKQVRSLASVALRKSLNSGTPYHFDYFAVDLNDEFSALYGPILYEQLMYVNSSIRTILELYKNKPNAPQKIILIGHSVGGVVARRAISYLEANKQDLVSVLITLAAPLKRNPLYFDRYASKFYKNIYLKHETYSTINIAGGYSDFLVPSYLTNIEENNTLNVVATNIPLSWVESNHVQILWCKQTVLAINRALFGSVDIKTSQISSNSTFVQQVFHHHLVHNTGTKLELDPKESLVTKLDYRGEWVESISKQYTVDLKKGLKQPHWYMVGLTTQHTYEMLTVLAINLEVTDWIFACSAAYPRGPSRVCVEGEHLTQYSEIAATSRYKRRLVTLNLNEIKRNHSEYTHVVFKALPTSEPVVFHVDIYNSAERRMEVTLPKYSLRKHTVIWRTPEKSVYVELIFPELDNLLQSYHLFVQPVSCASEQHHATATLIIPWANEMVYAHFTETLKKPFNLRIQNVKPPNATHAKVRLILEPSCTYQISIKLNMFGVFSHIARYYSTFIITNVAVVFLLAFQNQIYRLGKTGAMPLFFSSLLEIVKYSWLVIVLAGVLSIFLSYPFWTRFLPKPEVTSFPNKGDFIDLIVMPLILHIISVVVVFVLVCTYCVSLFTLESTVHKLTLKLLARTVTMTIRFSDYFMAFLQKVPFIVATVLILLCFSTCGGLALCVGTVFYFLKLTKMSQDYVEHVTWFILKNVARKIRKLFSKKPPPPQITNNQLTERSEIENEREEIELSVKDKEEEPDTDITPKTVEANEENDDSEENTMEIVEKVEENSEEQPNYPSTSEEINEEQPEQKEESENSKGFSFEGLSETNNAIFFHSSMFFIWVMVMGLNFPAVLTWAHNFKYSKHLPHDESFLPGLLLSIGAFPLWQFEFPSNNRRFTHELRLITLYFTIILLVYATVSVYVVNYLLTILFVLVVLQQYYNLATAQTAQEPSDSDDTKQHEDKYEEMKMKMD